jgi:hypothetical protein
MPLPPGHYQEVTTPRASNRRERWLVGLGGVLVAALVVVALVSLTSRSPKSGHGCLNFTYAMVMGGEQLHACGDKARRLCAEPPSFGGARFGGLANGLKGKLEDQCQQAGLPYATNT